MPQKSGTTWTQHIAHQLRVEGRPIDFDDQYEVMPWLENGFAWYGADLDAEQCAEPRVFKSHLPLKMLPSGTKKIYVHRDLGDSLYSLFWFIAPFLGLSGKVTVAAFFEAYLDRPKRRDIVEDELANLADWWRHRHDPSVLFMFYDDMRDDPAAAVSRVAEFMGLAPSRELLDTVVAQTSHSVMAAARGPSGKDPFDEHNLADLWARMLGLRPDQRSVLVGKVRKNGRTSGQAKLPEFVTAQVAAGWQKWVAAPLGFRSLAEMRTTWAAERRRAKL